MPVSNTTDKHLCAFILSPFEPSGLKSFKKKKNLEFPEPSKLVSNRIQYLKQLRSESFSKFAYICNQYGIVSTQICKEDSTDSDYSSDDETESLTDSDSYEVEAPTASRAIRPIFPSYSRRMSSKEFAMRLDHQSNLNFEHPHLNFNGMMWFRDDDVLINHSFHSILTVYQPLYDPRDFNDIKLCFDMNDPFLLCLYHPNIPTYMHRDFESIQHQELENDPENSELHTVTAKKHKEAGGKLPASVSMMLGSALPTITSPKSRIDSGLSFWNSRMKLANWSYRQVLR